MTLPSVPLKAQAAGVLALCLLSFVIGHGTRKTIEVEKIREVQVQAEKKVEQAKAEAVVAKQAAAKSETHWRTVSVYQPGGEVTVTKYVDRQVEKQSAEVATKVVEKVVTEEKLVYRDRQVTVRAGLPDWSVAAAGGLGLDGRLRYGGELGRRMFGGLWLTVQADVTGRAALAGLRWQW